MRSENPAPRSTANAGAAKTPSSGWLRKPDTQSSVLVEWCTEWNRQRNPISCDPRWLRYTRKSKRRKPATARTGARQREDDRPQRQCRHPSEAHDPDDERHDGADHLAERSQHRPRQVGAELGTPDTLGVTRPELLERHADDEHRCDRRSCAVPGPQEDDERSRPRRRRRAAGGASETLAAEGAVRWVVDTRRPLSRSSRVGHLARGLSRRRPCRAPRGPHRPPRRRRPRPSR